MRENVAEMIKAMENHHTAYPNYRASMHPSIHPDMWEDYLRKSHDTLMFYVAESKRIRRLDQQQQMQQQMQPHIQQYRSTYNPMQPMVPQQSQQASLPSQQSFPGHGSRTQSDGSDEMWNTAANTYVNSVMSTPNSANLSRGSQGSIGSLVRQLEDIADPPNC